MRILITGGAGFIGSSVADKLLEQQHEVLIVDNYQTGIASNNKPHVNLSVIEGSIANFQFVKNVFAKFMPHVVLHAAASYKDPDFWEEDVETNIIGTINIVKCSRAFNTNRIIYLQTSLCYGLEPIETSISLNHPLFSGKSSGGSSYAISKTSGEQYIALSGIEFVSFRLSNVFGPRNLSGPLPTFFNRLSKQLPCVIVNTKRDFIYIDDVVSVILKSISGVGKGYYHVSTGKDHSIKELFELVVKYMNIQGIKAEEKVMGADDVKTILLNPSKTQLDFDWTIKTSLEEGVKNTINWYNQHSLTKTYTHLKNIY